MGICLDSVSEICILQLFRFYTFHAKNGSMFIHSYLFVYSIYSHCQGHSFFQYTVQYFDMYSTFLQIMHFWTIIW